MARCASKSVACRILNRAPGVIQGKLRVLEDGHFESKREGRHEEDETMIVDKADTEKRTRKCVIMPTGVPFANRSQMLVHGGWEAVCHTLSRT